MDLENLLESLVPLIMAAFKILQNSDLMDALFRSSKLTEEQKEIITRLRKAAVEEFDDLAPDEDNT